MPVTQVNTHEAKSRLSELIRMVENGEEVVVARSGVPVVRLVRWTEQTRPMFGGWEGKVVEHGDIVGPDLAVADLFAAGTERE